MNVRRTAARVGAGGFWFALSTMMISPGSTDASEVIHPEGGGLLTISQERESARAALVAQHMVSLLERQIADDISDVSTADEAVLAGELQKYEEDAWHEAISLADRLEAPPISLADPKPKYECTTKYERFKCDTTESCDFSGKQAHCYVTNCGEGVCPGCPTLWNLNALIVHGWCTYACMDGFTLLGTKIVLHIALNNKLKKCLPLETPVP